MPSPGRVGVTLERLYFAQKESARAGDENYDALDDQAEVLLREFAEQEEPSEQEKVELVEREESQVRVERDSQVLVRRAEPLFDFQSEFQRKCEVAENVDPEKVEEDVKDRQHQLPGEFGLEFADVSLE